MAKEQSKDESKAQRIRTIDDIAGVNEKDVGESQRYRINWKKIKAGHLGDDARQTWKDMKYVGRKLAKLFESDDGKDTRGHRFRRRWRNLPLRYRIGIDALILGVGYLSLVAGVSALDIAYNKYVSKPDHYKIFKIDRKQDLKQGLKQKIADLLNSCQVPPEDVRDVEFVFSDFLIGGDKDLSAPRAKRVRLRNLPLDESGINHELGHLRYLVLGSEVDGISLWFVEECERREDTRKYYDYRGNVNDLARIFCFSINIYKNGIDLEEGILKSPREIIARAYEKEYSNDIVKLSGNKGCLEGGREREQVFAGIFKKNPPNGRKISPNDLILTLPRGWDDYPKVFSSYNRFYLRTGASFFKRYKQDYKN